MSILQEIMQEQAAAQQQEVASEEALRTLGKYAQQFKNHPGKLGSLIMVVIEELDLKGDAAGRDRLRAVVEPIFGRYVAKAPKVSQKRRDVQRRGGDQFPTRDEARKYAKQHGRRRVVDTKDTPGDRWSVEPRSRSEQKAFELQRRKSKERAKTSLRDT